MTHAAAIELSTGMCPGIDARGLFGGRSGNHPVRGEASTSPRTHLITYRVPLRPTVREAQRLQAWSDAAALLWNDGLAKLIQEYNTWKQTAEPGAKYQRPGGFALYAWWRSVREQPRYRWVMQRHTPQFALNRVCVELDLAYKAAFRRMKVGDTPGFPKFKDRGSGFRLQRVRITDRRVVATKHLSVRLGERGYIPRIEPKVVKMATFRRHAGRWWLTVTTECRIRELARVNRRIVVDVSGDDQMVLMGQDMARPLRVDLPLPTAAERRRLARLKRRMRRREVGSGRRDKAVAAYQRMEDRMASRRRYWIQTTTTEIVRRFDVIEVFRPKTLVEKGEGEALKERASMEIARQLEYKTGWYGGIYSVSVAE